MEKISHQILFLSFLIGLASCESHSINSFDPLIGLSLNSDNGMSWTNHVDSLISEEKLLDNGFSGYESVLVNGTDSLHVTYYFNSDGLKTGSLRDVLIKLNPDTTGKFGFRFIADTTRIELFENWFKSKYGAPDILKSFLWDEVQNKPYSSGRLSSWNKDAVKAQFFVSKSEEFDDFEYPVYRDVWFRIFVPEFDELFEQERLKHVDNLSPADYVSLDLRRNPVINYNDDPQFDIYIGYYLDTISRDRRSWYDFRTISEIAFTVIVEDRFGRKIHTEEFEYPINSGLQSGFATYETLYNIHNVGTLFMGAAVGLMSNNIIAQTAINSRHPDSSEYIAIKNNPDRYSVRYEINAIAFTDGTFLN